jgi:hypothetical protein
VNEPVPLLSEVLLSVIVGLAAVDHHTPRAVTFVPPSLITLPPQVAVFQVISVTEFVNTVGGVSGRVVKVFSSP